MLREPDATSDALAALEALGVRLVLDDFGTGFSSLSYLPRLPLHTLKIDRSFIDGLGTEAHDTAITEAIIAMSRALSRAGLGPADARGRAPGRPDHRQPAPAHAPFTAAPPAGAGADRRGQRGQHRLADPARPLPAQGR